MLQYRPNLMRRNETPLCAKSGHMQRRKFAFSTIQIQNFIVVPANHVLSVVPTKNPFGWSGLMPYLFFHQR